MSMFVQEVQGQFIALVQVSLILEHGLELAPYPGKSSAIGGQNAHDAM